MNQWLHEKGHKVLAKMGALVGKEKLVDCFKLDKSEYDYKLNTVGWDSYLSTIFDTNYENQLAQLVYVVDQSQKLDNQNIKGEGESFSYNKDLDPTLENYTMRK